MLKLTNEAGDPFLRGKTAIVNGASGGIGRAITEALLENGALVSAAYNKGQGVIDDLVQGYGRERVVGFRVDLLSDDYATAIERVVARTKEWTGRIDALINASGIWRIAAFLREEERAVHMIWRVNYFGAYSFAQKALPHMLTQGGNIINIASTSAIRGGGHQVSYSATKAALVALTQGLAEEFANRGIRVNAISPGPTDTPALDQYYDSHAKELLVRSLPIGRLCRPVDVANAVLGVLSNEYVTGENIALHGGRHP
jgi:3-oxoacyl-[acyl-carrier protein] reductase